MYGRQSIYQLLSRPIVHEKKMDKIVNTVQSNKIASKLEALDNFKRVCDRIMSEFLQKQNRNRPCETGASCSIHLRLLAAGALEDECKIDLRKKDLKLNNKTVIK